MVLGKEVLPIKVVVDFLNSWEIAVVVRVARADIAAIEAELQVLDGDMPLPFILGAQRDIATVVTERTDEFAL